MGPGAAPGARGAGSASGAIIVESEQDVFTAMVALEEGRGSFADALVAVLGMSAGCSQTVTFDRAALRLAGFSSV